MKSKKLSILFVIKSSKQNKKGDVQLTLELLT